MQLSVDQVLMRAKTLERKGERASARALLAEALAQYPANARLKQAVEALGKPRAKAPASQTPPQAELEIMIRLFHEGNYKALVEHGEKLARLFPASPTLFNILGAGATRLARGDLAARYFRRAIELDTGFVEAHDNLGKLLVVEKDWEGAADAFAQVLRLRPGLVEARRNLAEALVHLGRAPEAIDLYRKVLADQPRDAVALNGLALALIERAAFDEATEVARRAAEIDPGAFGIRLTQANLHRMRGETAAAQEAYRAILVKKPGMAKALRGLADLHRFVPGDPLMAQIEAAQAQAYLADDERCDLAFALAKAHGDLGNLKQTFDFLVQANHLRRRGLAYRIDKDVLQFRKLKAAAPAILAQGLPSDEVLPVVPIFIVAMPRSGTSLVEQILSRHAQVAGGGELGYMAQLGMDLATGARPATGDAIRRLRMDYLARVQPLAGGKAFVTDKMPHNFRLLPLIRAALPEAKILHLRRDPAAVCWSNFRQHFGSDALAYATDLGDVVAYYRLYAELMVEWRRLLGPAILTLDYDRLTVDQEAETRRLLDALGLPWDPACLAPHENRRVVRTASEQQVKQAVYQGSSQEWRKYEPFLNGLFDDLPMA